MIAKARTLTTKALQVVPLAVWSRLLPRRDWVFNYHVVADAKLDHITSLYAYKSAQKFAADLAFLRDRTKPADYNEFIAPRSTDIKSHPPRVLITFDDGLSPCYSQALPLLRDQGIPATFFITTDWIDNKILFYRHKISLCLARLRVAPADQRETWLQSAQNLFPANHLDMKSSRDLWLNLNRHDAPILADELCDICNVDWKTYLRDHSPYLTRKQIERMAEAGFTLGAHSCSHPSFRSLSVREFEREIVESCVIIAEITGRRPVPFAFPHGTYGLDRAWLRDIARKNPIVGALFGTQGFLPDPLIIHRIGADSPRGTKTGASNLPALIREAYARYPTSRLAQLLSRA